MSSTVQEMPRPLRVLIVEDERDALMTLGILLRSEGVEVRLGGKAADVTSAVQDFQPDVILLDIGLPDRSGCEVALELTRKLGEACPVLIAVTAHDGDTARRLTAVSGFRHHVAKPYDPDALLRLVTSMGPRG